MHDAYNKRTQRPGYQRPTTTGNGNAVADQSKWRKEIQPNRLKFDDNMKSRYLHELAQHGRKGDAALAVGVSLLCVRNHLKNDPDFEAAAEAALEAYRDKVVAHVQKLALEGTLVRKFDAKGNVIEEKQEYPIPLIMMEAKRVEKDYREKTTGVEINVDPDKTGVLVVPSKLTQDEWKERFAMKDITPAGSAK